MSTDQSTVTLDLETVRRLAAEAVEERGADYVYPAGAEYGGASCDYVRDGKPSCLVGEIFHRAGVSIETLITMDQATTTQERAAMDCGWNPDDPDGPAPCGDSSLGDWWPWISALGITVRGGADEAVREYLVELQTRQDYGTPWGAALRRAEDLLS